MNRILDILSDARSEHFDPKLEKKDDKRRKTKVKSLAVKPVIEIKDDYTDPPNPNLLRLPFSLLLVAPKGSGKTTVLHNILVWYFEYFDNIFIFSPTVNMDIKWRMLIEDLDIPPENLFTSYQEGIVSQLMGMIKDFNDGVDENKDKMKTLMIFDDIVESLPKGKKISALNKLAMNHRHYNVSHIIVSQSFKKLDPVVRSNTTGMILFNTDNSGERAKVVEELCGNLGRARFEQMWIECVSVQYGFMFLNYDTRTVWQNFDKEIGDLDCEPQYLFGKLERQGFGSKAITDGKPLEKEKDSASKK